MHVPSKVALRGARESNVVFYPRYQTSETHPVDTMTDFRVNEILSGNVPYEILESEVGHTANADMESLLKEESIRQIEQKSFTTEGAHERNDHASLCQSQSQSQYSFRQRNKVNQPKSQNGQYFNAQEQPTERMSYGDAVNFAYERMCMINEMPLQRDIIEQNSSRSTPGLLDTNEMQPDCFKV